MENLKKEWAAVCNAYLEAFCAKHGYDLRDTFWIGDEPGTVAYMADLFVGIREMRYDIDNNVPEEMFLKWYDYDLEVGMLEADNLYNLGVNPLTKISYEAFCKGAPLPYSEEKLRLMRDSAAAMQAAKEDFAKTVKECVSGTSL